MYRKPAQLEPFLKPYFGVRVNKIRKPGRPDLFYVRPHEVRVLFAGDQDADMNARIEHLFAAGPSARLTLRIHESKETMDVDITRSQLEEMGLSEGDEIGIQLSSATK
jgi:hypothetical protein